MFQKYMVRSILAFFCVALTSLLFAQNPELSQVEGSLQRGKTAALACPEQSAGTATPFLSPQSQSNDVLFLCFNDSLDVVHAGNQNLTGDPNTATPAGISYVFYDCQPTVAAGTLRNIQDDPCTTHRPFVDANGNVITQDSNRLWLATPPVNNGNIHFRNDGALQRGFNNGRPVRFFFAPITVDRYPRTWENGGTCVKVTTSNAFSVIYLNQITATNVTYTSNTTGSFVLNGGLPEWDNSNYTITIRETNGGTGVGTITSGAATNSSNVQFSVSKSGTYQIQVTDNKDCRATTFLMSFPTVTLELDNVKVANTGQDACVAMTVKDFTDIIGIQGSIQFDPKILVFKNTQNNALPDAGNFAMVVQDSAKGILTFSWNSSGAGVTFPDNTVLFEICFRTIGANGTISPVSIENDPTRLVFEKSDGTELGVSTISGSVSIGNTSFGADVTKTDVGCENAQSGAIRIIPKGGIAPYRYSYQHRTNVAIQGMGVINTSGDTLNINNLSQGTYDILMTDASLPIPDTFRSSVTINLPTPISIAVLSTTPESCAGNDGAIRVRATGGTGIYQYSWTPNTTDSTASVTKLKQGAYRLLVTDNRTCFKDTTITITGAPPPRVTAKDSTPTKCFNSKDGAIRLTVQQGGSPIRDYRWSDNGRITTTPELDQLGKGKYYVTITDNSGCSNRDSFTITSPDTLLVDTINTTFRNPTCPSRADGEIIVAVKGGTPAYSFAIANRPQQTGGAFSQLVAGNYAVTVTDANGCQLLPQNVARLNFQLQDPPPIRIVLEEARGVSCNGGNCDGRATVTASGGQGTGKFNFEWESTGSNTLNDTRSTDSLLCQGEQKVRVSDNFCIDSLIVVINAPEKLIIDDVQATPVRCFGESNGNAIVSASGGTAPYSFLWSTGSTDDNINNVRAGDYTVTVTDNNNCPFSNDVNIPEPDRFALDTVAAETRHVTCYGDSTGQITWQTIGGNAGNIQYQWTPNVSTTKVGSNLGAGIYTTVATDSKGCEATNRYEITQPDSISYTFDIVERSQCHGDPATIQVSSATGGTGQSVFYWQVDGGSLYQIGETALVNPGDHNIAVVEGATGCINNRGRGDDINIQDPPSIVIEFDSIPNNKNQAEIVVGLGEEYRFDPQLSYSDSSAITYDSVQWSPTTYFTSSADLLRATIRPLEDISYTLTVTANGCKESEIVNILIDKNRNVFIPNIFTPNGDGNNDFFGPLAGAGVSKINYIRIFDRWGELIYEGKDLDPTSTTIDGWDGMYRGKKLDSGVYVYLIQVAFADSKVLLYRGDINLIR